MVQHLILHFSIGSNGALQQRVSAQPRLNLPHPLGADPEPLSDSLQAEPGDPESGHLPLPLSESLQVEARNDRSEPRASLLERLLPRAHGQFFAGRYPVT